MTKFKKYNFIGSLNIFLSYTLTKLFYSNSRLIRYPYDFRNTHLINFGINLTTGKYCRFEAHNDGDIRLEIGHNVQINDSVHIVCGKKVIIENNVLIASKVFISDTSHGSYGNNDIHDNPLIPPNNRLLHYKDVKICSNVWIGEYVSILPGVTLGEGCIIGSMSVVTSSIPPYTIAVGAPAKPIKKFNFNNHKWEKI